MIGGVWVKELTDSLKYTFQNESLLHRALTHPSAGGEDNQRLEFLGDAVLQYCMSRVLYEKYPSMSEGGLTHRRALLVCEAALAKVAGAIGLNNYLIMNKSQEQDGGRENPSILADAMEAVLAAVCIDGTIDTAMALVKRLWPEEESVTPALDAKSALQEWVQAKGQEAPTYVLLETEGPPHNRLFTAQVNAQGLPPFCGKGKTKRQAEQEAARRALDHVNGSGGSACG
jgi:ribonuclease-3